MSFRDRFRFAIAGVDRTRGRPGVELVRVDQPDLLAAQRRALPAPRAAVQAPAPGSSVPPEPAAARPAPAGPSSRRRLRRGTFAPYAQQLVFDSWDTTSRPRPIGHTATETADLIRAGFHPWNTDSTGEPPPSEPLSVRDRVRSLWYGDSID